MSLQVKQQNRDATEYSMSNQSLMCVYLGTLAAGPGEDTSDMWTTSGGKRCELREFQESHRQGSLCSTGNTTASGRSETEAQRAAGKKIGFTWNVIILIAAPGIQVKPL